MNLKTETPDIYIYIATGIKKPNRKSVLSIVRKYLDSIVALGRIVYILINDKKVYQWDNLSFGPMFNSFDEFHQFYNKTPYEIGAVPQFPNPVKK